MFISLFILLLGVSPVFLYFWLGRRMETQIIGQLSTVRTSGTVTHWRRLDLPPDTQYVEGIGYLIGDITCQYNSRSSYIRCAVNPSGPCQGCRFYTESIIEENR